jgi:hypothetical protein
MSTVGGNFLGYYLLIFLFLSGVMGEIYCFVGGGNYLGYYNVKPCLFCILR